MVALVVALVVAQQDRAPGALAGKMRGSLGKWQVEQSAALLAAAVAAALVGRQLCCHPLRPIEALAGPALRPAKMLRRLTVTVAVAAVRMQQAGAVAMDS